MLSRLAQRVEPSLVQQQLAVMMKRLWSVRSTLVA